MSEIEGLAKLKRQLNRLKGVTPHAMLAGALVLQRYAQMNAPVVTGFLRNSAISRETEKGAEMEFAANYAFYVEFGTSERPGRGYVRRAIDEHSQEIVQAVKEQVQKDIKDKLT